MLKIELYTIRDLCEILTGDAFFTVDCYSDFICGFIDTIRGIQKNRACDCYIDYYNYKCGLDMGESFTHDQLIISAVNAVMVCNSELFCGNSISDFNFILNDKQIEALSNFSFDGSVTIKDLYKHITGIISDNKITTNELFKR